MPHDPYGALYIHIPFCTSRCFYCDFATEACPQDAPAMDAYVEELCLDLRKWNKAGEFGALKTIYIGGGTPTHLGSRRLSQLLYTISLSINLEQLTEYTLEANPESITLPLIKDAYALGVNRLSIGVQSFDDQVLQLLGRAHTAEKAIEAIKMAQERFDNISIDLMCGIPGQSEESFTESLRLATSLGVKHISIYPLTIEPGTPLYKEVQKGRFPEVNEDVQARHMELAAEILQAAGFVRYEVANYALCGYESKHNSSYWQGVPYLGLGRSACTMTQNAERRMRKQDGIITDDLNPAQMAAEDLMLSMRMAQGVRVEQVEAAKVLLPQVLSCFEELCTLGLVEKRDGRYRPTTEGWLCGNELYGRIFDLA